MSNGGEVLVQTLISRAVDTVFFVPGGTYTTVLRAPGAPSAHAGTLRAAADLTPPPRAGPHGPRPPVPRPPLATHDFNPGDTP